MKAFLLEPEQPGREIEIENTLEALQAAVGGYIEVVTLGDGLAAIVNEEGKQYDLPFNRGLYAGGMDPVDYLFGNVLIVGTDGEEFRELTPAELDAPTHDHRAITSGVTIRRRSA